MLGCLLALLVGAAPLMSGAWDLWAQSALFLALAAGTCAWLSGRILIGYLPLPSARASVWAAALALLGFSSAHLSPVWAAAVPAWRVWLAALWVFIATTAVSKDQRWAVDEAVRACGWVLLLLCFYQHYHDKMPRPPGSLLNENVLAAAALLLLPLAGQKRDWLLGGGLLVVLFWARSVGAWLGLAAALVVCRRDVGLWGYRLGLALGLACAVAVYAKFQSADVADRLRWWSEAARMSLDRPWLGFGPGAFAAVAPGYQRQEGLWSLYAHQHLLETAAQCGWPFALLWLAGVVHCLRVGGPHKSFGALAVLVQSLWDYSLSIPANLWLFSYFLASALSESPRGLNIASRYKLPACLLTLGLGGASCSVLWDQWQAERLRVEAARLLSAGGPAERARTLLASSEELGCDAETARLAAVAALRRAAPSSSERGRLLTAAAALERSLEENPYRASNWLSLEDLYRRLGLAELAAAKRREAEAFLPRLRTAS